MPHNYRLETHHPWPDSTWFGGLVLVLSNLILIPIILDLIMKWRWDYASALTATMVVSIFYHSCRAGIVCEYRFRDQQITDHIFVFLSITYVAARLGVRRSFFPRALRMEYPELLFTARVALFFLLLVPTVMANMYNPESFLPALFGFVVPTAIVVLGSLVSGERLFYNTTYGIAGTVLFLVSVVFYSCAPHAWYQWSHSLWHCLSMISVYFIVYASDPPVRYTIKEDVAADAKK